MIMKRPIDSAALIGKLRTRKANAVGHAEAMEAYENAMNDAIDAEELSLNTLRDEAKQPKWISVKEQSKPPKDGEYWCFGYWIGSGRKQTEVAEYLCGEWKIVNNFVLTHWMPLPEPPEEE